MTNENQIENLDLLAEGLHNPQEEKTIKDNDNDLSLLNKKNTNEKIQKIETLLKEKLPQFIDGNADKYIKSLLFEIVKSKSDSEKDLTTCTQASILTAVKQAIDLGLEIDGRKHGHLIKRNVNVGTKEKQKWVAECHFQVGYAGFIYSIKREIPDANIIVNLVKEGDIFTIKKEGDIEEYNHIIKDPFAGQDKIIGGYCYISFSINNRKIAKVEVMSKKEIDNIKSCAKSTKIWEKWYEEKAKVAIIRRACKIIFAGLNSDKINKLLEQDNQNYDLSVVNLNQEEEISELQPKKIESVFINDEQQEELKQLANKKGVSFEEICQKSNAESLNKINVKFYPALIKGLNNKPDVVVDEVKEVE